MTTTYPAPPKWAEILLECLLSRRDREAIAGDLREEYMESILPSLGRLRADIWYLRQIPGFAQRCVLEETTMTKVMFCSSLSTLLCGCWLSTMELLLRHPGYRLRVSLELTIIAICIAAILVRVLHAGMRVERWLWPAGLALIGLGGASFFRNARAAHFEGFVALVSLAFALQGTMMVLSLGRAEYRPEEGGGCR
jgi:hypothetical protein